MLFPAQADALLMFFSGSFALVLAVGRILEKQDDEHLNIFLLLLAVAGNQLGHAFLTDRELGHVRSLPLRLLVLTSITMMGPLFYRYVDGLLGIREGERRVTYGLVAALVGGMAIIATLEMTLTETKARPLPYSGLVAVIVFIVFQAYLIYRARDIFLLPASKSTVFARLALCLSVGAIFIALLSISGILTSPAVRRGGQLGIGIFLILIYWLSKRFPRFLSNMGEAIAHGRYMKSGLHRLNVNEIVRKMRVLMEQGRLYALEGLSLSQLADALDIQRHALSEILNSKLRRGFHSFVNEYRVQAACELLREQPDRSTLSIGVAVGFNSNSAFYKAFQQFQGMSPAKYRQEADS